MGTWNLIPKTALVTRITNPVEPLRGTTNGWGSKMAAGLRTRCLQHTDLGFRVLELGV